MITMNPDGLRRARVGRGVSMALIAAVTWTSLPHTAQATPPRLEVPEEGASDLSEGSIGPRVTQVQEALIDGGAYLPGGADGVYGSATTTAIRQYQGWNGLERTGTLDAATVRRLNRSSDSATSSPSSSTSAYEGLTLGSSGDAVVEVQRALLDTGLVIKGEADGVFGLATRRALMAFQRVNGMTETGRMSERAAHLLDLGDHSGSSGSSGSSESASVASTSGTGQVSLERFPVQGNCAFADTWHAPRGGGRVHEGVDIIAATGNLLYAVADGTITTQWWDSPDLRAGNGLKLTAPDGTYYVYLHMSGFAPGITRGTEVQTGDVIGFVGNTGSSATPHLHFEIHPGGGGPVNPYPYVRAIDGCSDTRARYQSSFA